ncbi:RAM signaling pathway family protein [Candida parapsilosis]|uniref:RAM signaling pathway family protein n=1 Tax=Candida parapsilosis TaxID=5480 RepID=A0A8X7NMK3_CANPA|nr:RAM signaling pathway family protein [Candida parapsilosis]
MDLLQENLTKFVSRIDVCFIRMLYLSIFGSFNELRNAYILLTTKPKVGESKLKLTINTNVGSSFNEVDEKLYATVESAIANAQTIFTELNKDVHRGASANAASVSSSVAAKVKDLGNVCGSSLDITKRLNTKLITIRNNPSHATKKQFAEDTNQFLKSIVQILAAVKSIVVDIPILEDVRAPMSSLTKSPKRLPTCWKFHLINLIVGFGNKPAGSNGPVPVRNPIAGPPNLSTVNLPDAQTSIMPTNGPLTAPPQSSGQMFAKNGMNPFDKLILSKNEET